MFVTKPRAIALYAAAVSLLAGCGDGTGPTSGPIETAVVSVADNRFTPQANAIAAGESVTWTWTGANPHNVTFDDPSVGNSTTQVDGTFSKAFTDGGEYTYYCTVHGRALMSGRVVVNGEPVAGGGGPSGY